MCLLTLALLALTPPARAGEARGCDRHIGFAPDSAALSGNELGKLQPVIEALRRSPQATLTILGLIDGDTRSAYAWGMVEARMRAIVAQIRAAGITPRRVRTRVHATLADDTAPLRECGDGQSTVEMRLG